MKAESTQEAARGINKKKLSVTITNSKGEAFDHGGNAIKFYDEKTGKGFIAPAELIIDLVIKPSEEDITFEVPSNLRNPDSNGHAQP